MRGLEPIKFFFLSLATCAFLYKIFKVENSYAIQVYPVVDDMLSISLQLAILSGVALAFHGFAKVFGGKGKFYATFVSILFVMALFSPLDTVWEILTKRVDLPQQTYRAYFNARDILLGTYYTTFFVITHQMSFKRVALTYTMAGMALFGVLLSLYVVFNGTDVEGFFGWLGIPTARQ